MLRRQFFGPAAKTFRQVADDRCELAIVFDGFRPCDSGDARTPFATPSWPMILNKQAWLVQL